MALYGSMQEGIHFRNAIPIRDPRYSTIQAGLIHQFNQGDLHIEDIDDMHDMS